MWCDDERLKDAETTVIGQKNIVQALGAFLGEPRVAAVAWAKLSAVYEGLAEKESFYKTKRFKIWSNASEFARTVFIMESLLMALCDYITLAKLKRTMVLKAGGGVCKVNHE